MAEDLRRWKDDCVDELCDIVFGQWMLGNFAAGLPRESLWDVITDTLNAWTGKNFCQRQANQNANNLQKKGCLDYDKLKQLFALKETDGVDQTQAASKRLMQEANAKGKKVAKKSDKVSEMTVALKEYTTMTMERFSANKGKSSGTSEQFAQSAARGDPCSLGKAIDMLNQYEDLKNKEYLKISRALHVKKNRVVFMGMQENKRLAWMEEILNPEN
nr:hypothetical protein CFP56_06237 [Quercus suber]